MGIVDNLLTASRRPSREALRVTAALNETLDGPLLDPDGTSDGLSVVAAADAAHQRVALEISEEKNPRPAPPAEHTEAFIGGAAVEESLIRDAPPATDENVRTDPYYLLVGDDSAAGEEENTSAATPWHILEKVAVASDTTTTPDAEEEQISDEDCSDEPDASVSASDLAGDPEAAGTGRIPVPVQPPSTTDDYPAGLSGFSAGEELALPPLQPSPSPALPPSPSTKSTPPPDWFDAPTPDDEGGLAERVRKRVADALGSLRGRGGRPKLAAAAAGTAAVLIIALVAVFSLSGGRGKPPEPAGVTAAPPVVSDNPAPVRAEAPLVPATVSASCVGDSDAVAPFSGEKSRAWVCGRANGLDGSVLNIAFGKAVVVTQITIVPGFNYVAPDGRDEWSRHRLVTGVTWRLGGKTYPQAINPTRTGATLKLPSVVTQEMSLTITASTRPLAPAENAEGIGKADGSGSAVDADATTAISSIIITGYPVDQGT